MSWLPDQVTHQTGEEASEKAGSLPAIVPVFPIGGKLASLTQIMPATLDSLIATRKLGLPS